jgi:hypothetical protein
MTQHDTWVHLKPGNPLEPIAYLFPEGIPMRDPFPMSLATDGETLLWITDTERLLVEQANAIATVIAQKHGVDVEDIMHECMNNGGFAIGHHWVDCMYCGAEGHQRTKEVYDFMEKHPEPTPEQFQAFLDDQIRRWIDGNEEPQPITHVTDIDQRLRMEGQREALEHIFKMPLP